MDGDERFPSRSFRLYWQAITDKPVVSRMRDFDTGDRAL